MTAEGAEAEGAAGAAGLEPDLAFATRRRCVAQPASHVQQMPKANQKVADLFERRMLKNLQCSRQCR